MPPLPKQYRRRYLSPAKLLCCPSPVVVGAAHIALGDSFEHSPTCEAQQTADRHALVRRVAVIEIEDQRIALAAIDARVVEKIFDQATQILGFIDRVVAAGGGDVLRLVALVMTAIPLRVAGTAVAVKNALGSVLEGECAQLLDRAAAATAFLTPLREHEIVV